MKKFKIHYIKYGKFGNHSFDEIVEARNAEIALKKFYNYKGFPKDKTRAQMWDYDFWANGISYSNPEVIELD